MKRVLPAAICGLVLLVSPTVAQQQSPPGDSLQHAQGNLPPNR